MKNVAATARNVKRYTAAKLDFWEAGHFTDGSKHRTRRNAKRELARAIRRTEKAHIAEQE